MMKKFQSFEDIINYLNTEQIPYKDNKQDILKRLNTKFISKRVAYRKLCIICAALLTLTISVALTFGYIKEHEEFVKVHDGEIKGKLIDDRGDIVIQTGVVDDVENYGRRMQESEQRAIASKKFEDIAKSLENKLPDDKVAVFIPVKGLEAFIDFNILNWHEYYYTIEDMKNNISNYSPLPGYIPQGLAFCESCVYYEHENFYKPYEEDMTYKEFLTKLFEEAKEDQKDYYYKEYNRLNEVTKYRIEYEGNGNTQKLYLDFKKGKTTILYDTDTNELTTEIIEHNGRKYLKDEISYYTYVYIEDDLWTITITTGLEEDEILRIMESVE